jgi:hypothetical protein
MSLDIKDIRFPNFVRIGDGKECVWRTIDLEQYQMLLIKWDVMPKGWSRRKMLTDAVEYGEEDGLPVRGNVWHLWFKESERICFVLYHSYIADMHKYAVTAVDLLNRPRPISHYAATVTSRTMYTLYNNGEWPSPGRSMNI